MNNKQYSKATKETAENLRVIDDAMFRLVAERKEVCQEILRTLLDRPQLKVLKVTPQCVTTSLHRLQRHIHRKEQIFQISRRWLSCILQNMMHCITDR